MRLLPWCLGTLALVACTQRNPDYCDEDEPCPDPAKPFCDLDGLVDGSPNSCIPVACTPGEFKTCDDDRAIQCNTAGNNYDVVLCERGCDPVTSGCRLCDPGETACTNGIAATCDASGAVVSMEACVLGCFESEPRCRYVDPSNGLAEYLDMAATGPDVTLTDGQEIESGSGGTTGTDIPSFLLPAPPDGVQVRVFPVKSLTVNGTVHLQSDPNGIQPAVAFVSYGDVIINGTIILGTKPGREPGPAPGSLSAFGTVDPCMGGVGLGDATAPDYRLVTGGGGGGHATQGGAGGRSGTSGGGAGAAFPNDDLQPLRGGCTGGNPDNQAQRHAWGGGAIQITSGTRIDFMAGARIDANGAPGVAVVTADNPVPGARNPGGGGSGGGILLEAPFISLGAATVLTANGGAGASGDMHGAPATSLDMDVTPGAVCTFVDEPPNTGCGDGGNGGAALGPPTAGQTVMAEFYEMCGGGGGAHGYIRINTRDGTYLRANDATESPAPISAELRTR